MLQTMNYASVFAIILPLLCHLIADVNGRKHHGGRFPPQHPGAPGAGGSTDVDRNEIFDHGFHSGFSKLCSHRNPLWKSRLPEFLKNVTDEGLKKFCEILRNQNLKKFETLKELEQWAKDQGSDVFDGFNKYVEGKKEKLGKIEKKMQQLIADTTKFIEDVKNIVNDMSLTKGEEREKLLNLAQQTNRSVLVLAVVIAKEAGFPVKGHHGRPCPGCRPVFPHRPRPSGPNFRPHTPPHIGLGMPGREPYFPEDGFRPNVPFGQNGPFRGNGFSLGNGGFPIGKNMHWGMNMKLTDMENEENWSENDSEDNIFDNE
ncbi:unnamed protein product [Toxocara canis]|uniref:SXP/RAL-2 family protein Ani s 5-like cation-binding domain-containing protein n=1 Tax=Toxocara canis TaxID=6265 RepID=A0A3P7GF97_TOXCA|nr:unnamed protein product [Toxocara canis]